MNQNLSAQELDPDRLSNSLIPTLIVLVIGSVVGVFLGGMFMMLASAPVSIFALPAFLAAISVAVSWGVFVVPIWGLLGGGLFAMGAVDSIRNKLNVQLLPDADPIAMRIQELAQKLNLPPVKYIGYYEGDEINAFAAGVKKDAAMIAFTKGAIAKLTREQFDAVMAHEIGHIANNDMRRMTYARSFQDVLTWFLMFQGLKRMARWLFTFISEIGILSLSRSREYRADAIASVITEPNAMIGALTAIAHDQSGPPRQQRRFGNIMLRANSAGLFNTHPSINQRIKAIETKRYIQKLPLRSVQLQANEFVTAPLASEAFTG